MLNIMQEKRPLKRPKLGPPDVYPQDAKQKEDELTATNVKQGFISMLFLQGNEEFGTARNCNVTASKVGAYFNAILARREELMTLPDSGRKKQQINVKDNFWHVSNRSRATLDIWFKDLAGNKPMTSLSKRAPSFNKKEDIFPYLCDNQVSMQKAAWFIKLNSAYTTAVSEAKIKKRQMPDPTTEWTGTIIKFMKDLIPKLQDHYHQSALPEKTQNFSSNANTPTNNPTVPPSMTVPQPLTSPASNIHSPATTSTPSSNQQVGFTVDDYKTALRQWTYCTQLCKYMFEEGLLDRHEFLNWVLDILDKMKSQPSDDGILKLFLPMTMQYMPEFVQSERLSRRLAYMVCKKLSYMIYNALEAKENLAAIGNLGDPRSDQHLIKVEGGDIMSNVSPMNHSEVNSNIAMPSKSNGFMDHNLNDYLQCPHHRDLIIQLSAVLQVITIECPTALVWCGLGETRASAALVGSPLDHIPIPPSALPIPNKSNASVAELQTHLREAEANIRKRSSHAEAKWCTDKWQNKNGNTSAIVLASLDALDSHCFDRMDTNNNNNLEALYGRIFHHSPFVAVKQETGKGGELKETKIDYDPNKDAPIVQILLSWAVSSQRFGEHRAMAVAWLLDKRQSEVTASDTESSNADDKESIGSGTGLYGGVPVFQSILMNFLDKDAPVLEENGSIQNRSQFTNLVHLFSELIRHDVFSHDAYMCTLISRGDLLTGSSLSMKNATAISAGTGPVSNKTSPHNQNQGLDDDMFDFKPKMEEFDDSNVDDDLDKILQNIKEDQQNAMDAPDSPKDSEQHHHSATHMTSDPPISRHFLYAKHFPLCQDDSVSQHDTNQRYILLFGVGKERDEKKHAVKKMSKEICKLFSKKFSIDVAEGGKVKKHSKSEFNFEATTNKCQSMSYFDQHVVTWQCAVTVQEMLNSFAMGNSNYLPVQEHVAFLFDLMEMALNIYGLIDMCIQILKELPEVESQLMAKNSILMKSYTTSLSLYVVGVLRRYHCCLLLSPDQTSAVFEGLCKVVKHVTNPGDCSSAERCILAYLFDLYSSCSLLKTKPQSTEPFHNAYPKIKLALYAQLTPVATTQYSCKRDFMADVLANPRRGGKIEPSWGRQLNESAANRYSFVCNALIAVSQETDNDRLNDISQTCAELTACCNSLSTEWLGALIALCGSSNEPFYQDILGKIDIQNLSIHNSLAVFTCILVARHCFLLEKFVCHVALPPLVACSGGSGGREITPEAEAGARLSCHLLLRLFRTIEIPQPGLYSVSTSPNPITTPGPACNIKLSCDRHLLAAAHKNIDVGPVLAVLKGILVVGDATCLQKAPSTYSSGKRSGLNTPVHPGSTPKSMSGPPIDLSHILGTSELGTFCDGDEPMLDLSHLTNSAQNENTSSLSDFAQHVLRQICSQEWVLERCLQNADELCLTGFLIDEMLTPKQAQRLLHMICYPENESNIKSEMDQKSIIVRILENLEQWSLRISWVDLQLMFKQTNTNTSSPSPELNHWLDTVARAAIDVFHVKPNQYKQDKSKSMWLVAPLVSKLHSSVQGRILRVAGNVLESTNFFTTTTKKVKEETNEDSNESNDGMEKMEKLRAPQMSHQAFLGLILTCLKGQDEQKEGLLSSLHSQLSQFLQSSNELDAVGGIEYPQGREQMLDALQLRFSLVGGMFDAIQKNSTATTDWAILFAQLISQGVIDLSTNSELFTTVLDMLATLIHSTLISDSQSERDENKKLYINLMKKLKKELGDRNNPSVKFVRQLLPLSKQTCEVIACESAGCLTDTKGNKISGFDSIDKKPGLKLSDKQRVNVWDFLEGHKNPAPLSWAWFGAVKMERRPLHYEETHRLLKYHTHSLVKPSSYYYDPLPLPPEDLEPLPEKPKEEKADTPSSVDQSPGTILSGRGRGKGVKRPKKPKATAPIQPIQAQQQANQQHQQQQMQNNPMQNNPMQMNMQNQLNPNMQQFQSNQMQNQGQMQNQNQMQNPMMSQVPGGMSGVMTPQGQQSGMGFGGGQMQMAQQQQWPQGFNPMQQQQQQQQFYNQGMQPQMNRFERPQINNQSKQALSIMLRQRHPPFISGNQTGNPGFNMQQQQQHQQSQQQQHQQYANIRSSLRGMNPAQMGNNQMGGMVQPMGPGINPNSMMSGQTGQMAPNQIVAQNQQPGIGGIIGQTSGGMMQQTGRITPASMGQSAGMIGQSGSNMIPQANRTMVPTTMMSQQATGMVPQGMNSAGGVPGIQQGVQGGQQVQGGIFPGTQQFGGMAQNFGGSYSNQGMPQQSNLQQNMQMGSFNQMNAQRSQAEFLAQQQQQRNLQQQQVNQQQVQANRGQFAQQVPNVTMNQGMNQGMNTMVGQGAPPYQRQQPTGNPQQQQQQLFQSQQQQQQRLRQQQLLMQQQQQQQLGMAQQGAQGMQPNQGQGLVSQQTPALVAQLQRQMPNQPGGMMNQQYSQQPY